MTTVTLGLVHIHVDAVSGEVVGGGMEPILNDGVSRKFGSRQPQLSALLRPHRLTEGLDRAAAGARVGPWI